jgi:hypothetical protein
LTFCFLFRQLNYLLRRTSFMCWTNSIIIKTI